MNKEAPTKQIDDYEPISGGAVCLAVAVTLATSFFVQSLNEENKKNIFNELHEINKDYTFEWLENKLDDAELMLQNMLRLIIKDLIINFKYYNNKNE